MKSSLLIGVPILVAMLAGACGTPHPGLSEAELTVVATTSIVADVVARIGGDRVTVTTLLPLGSDPHTFEPRPQDAIVLAEAAVVFASGAGLEEFLEPLLESAGATGRLVEVSGGIELLPFEEQPEAEGEPHGHEGGDPHTWMDPDNVLIWAENIAAALAAADPEHAAVYQANARAYGVELRALDAWIRDRVAEVPPENRWLVSDHATLGYFAEAYGFEVLGTITGSFSTNAAPSAQELAALEDEIRSYKARAIFVGETVSQDLADRVAEDTGIQVVMIYHGSLSAPDGPAPDYLGFMRYNVAAIVEALR